jgi:1,4-dihydroxy-2-naphthoate octaprenyltransferase
MLTWTRKSREQQLTTGDKDHRTHRLAVRGFFERQSVIILWLFAVAGSLLAIAIVHLPVGIWEPLVAGFTVIAVAFVHRVSGVQLVEPQLCSIAKSVDLNRSDGRIINT